MESKMYSKKLVNTIRQIEAAETIHEYFDVVDFGIDVVLSWYGNVEEWNEDECKVLKDCLLSKAYSDEIKEVSRIAEFENDPLIASIPDREAPSLKLLIIEHAIWKKEMANKKKTVENPKDSQLSVEVRK